MRGHLCGLAVAIRDRAINCLDTAETLGIGELRNLLIRKYRFFYPRKQEGSLSVPTRPLVPDIDVPEILSRMWARDLHLQLHLR